MIDNKIVSMCEMPLGSVGKIVSESPYHGNIVRRNISTQLCVVENLSDPKDDNCWTWTGRSEISPDNYYKVELLPYSYFLGLLIAGLIKEDTK